MKDEKRPVFFHPSSFILHPSKGRLPFLPFFGTSAAFSGARGLMMII
jgi:hypothetical protein